jgi:hypothetical protein
LSQFIARLQAGDHLHEAVAALLAEAQEAAQRSPCPWHPGDVELAGPGQVVLRYQEQFAFARRNLDPRVHARQQARFAVQDRLDAEGARAGIGGGHDLLDARLQFAVQGGDAYRKRLFLDSCRARDSRTQASTRREKGLYRDRIFWPGETVSPGSAKRSTMRPSSGERICV